MELTGFSAAQPCHAKAKSSGFSDALILYPGLGVPESHGASEHERVQQAETGRSGSRKMFKLQCLLSDLVADASREGQ
jgi:hypothetical protein